MNKLRLRILKLGATPYKLQLKPMSMKKQQLKSMSMDLRTLLVKIMIKREVVAVILDVNTVNNSKQNKKKTVRK